MYNDRDKINLNQIGLYNAHRVSDSQSEALFVTRKKQLNILLDAIRHESTHSIPQHHLIIAPRGMGKTTLLKRIEVELRKEKFNEIFIPLLLPEEQYNVRNLNDFWLNCLEALASVMAMEHNAAKTQQIDAFKNRRCSDELSINSYEFLTEVSAELGRRPVLLIDNLNLIFDRLHLDEQHIFRSLMMQNNAPIIIGASTTYIDGTTEYGAPFYDAFRMHYLEKLNVKEFIDILINLSYHFGDQEIISSIPSHTPQIKVLHQLSGGNPRSAVMLFKHIINGFSTDIIDDIESLLDESTPIFKARFEALSNQMQIIVDAIALHWEPVTLAQLRHYTRFDNGQLSPLLKRLSDMGWITKPGSNRRKGGAYELKDRFFNLWLLMRRSTPRKKKGIYYLSHFLQNFYGTEFCDEVHKCPNFLQNIDKKSGSSIDIGSMPLDAYWLNEALIALNVKNAGVAAECLINAFGVIGSNIPAETQVTWIQFASFVAKLDYTKWFLTHLEENGYDLILSPYYTAIEALATNDVEFLDTVAADIREVTKEIMIKIQSFN